MGNWSSKHENGKPKKNGFGAEIESVLKSVDLNGYANRYPSQLSGGEKQRLAIARAIASRSNYLLMDEPFSSLDPLLKKELRELVLGLRSSPGMGIVYVTHNMEEIFAIADCIAVMNKGSFEQIGMMDDVIKKPQNGFVRRFVGAE
ncbi:MAG: ATP-binding cassette domain-containing protein [Pseudomonadota bacterium]